MRVFRVMTILIGLGVGIVSTTTPVAWGATNAQNFVYQGRLLNSDGSAPLTGIIDMTFGIYDPSGTCLLYEERDAGIDLSQSSGVFAVSVGTATKDAKRTASDPGLTMDTVFANTSNQIQSAGTLCTSGYTPLPGDHRLLRVTVTPLGGAPITLSPDQTIGSMPQAQVAETLQGLGPTSFIQIQDNVSQTTVGQLTSGGDASALHNHDSLYAKTGSSSNVSFGSVRLSANPTTALQACTKGYVDTAIGGLVTGVSSFNTRSGAITLTQADVATALGVAIRDKQRVSCKL